MDYSTIINDSIEKVYQNGIATKIMQHMDRIRNVSDLGQARRWIMELLQNSQDTAYSDQAVRVRVILDEDKLQFLHNGRPFRTKDILSIVNQVSSKDPDENTVGQFGTGFMTTYQLSEVVEIQSVLKDEGLPYKPFSVKIDRRGEDKDEILANIFQTMEELKKADEAEEMRDFNRDDYHTRFIYHLEGERSRRIAKTGMDDLKETILYVLLFVQKIGSVELEYRIGQIDEKICFQRGEDIEVSENLRKLVIKETVENSGDRKTVIKETVENSGGRKRAEHSVMYSQSDGLTLAACMDADMGFLKIPKLVPRIFVGFPLIGAEDFPFPVILNSEKFCPNEPRSGITLVDNENSKDAVLNKQLIQQAVLLYQHFLHTLVQLHYKGLEHIVSVPQWKADKEISEIWVKEHLYAAIYDIVSKEPMILTSSGYCCLESDGMYLVSAETEAEREGVKQLLSVLKGYLVVAGEDHWLEAFAGFKQHKKKVIRLKDLLMEAQTLMQDFLEEEQMPAMEWCRRLYQLGRENYETSVGISAGETAVFPNQNAQDWKQRKLFKINELYRASELSEILKDVSEALDELTSSEEIISIRTKLLHQDFMDLEIAQIQEYPVMELYNYIARRTNRQFRVIGYSARQSLCMGAWHNAWSMMLACCPDEDLYWLAELGWTQELPQYQPCVLKSNDFMWKNTYVGVLSEIIQELYSQGNLENIRRHFHKIGAEEFYGWFNGLIKKSSEYIFGFNSMIYPDQTGQLHLLNELSIDGIEHQELKEIAEGFAGVDKDCDICRFLLDKEIKIEHIGVHVCSDQEAARRISSAVTSLLTQQDLSAADMLYQESCTKLLAWIQENYDEAARLFPAFWKEEDQMKLLTAKAAVVIQKKANAYEELLTQLGTDDPEEAMEQIKQMRRQMHSSQLSESGSFIFDDAGDVFYDESLLESCPQEGLLEKLRAIGKAGEQYVLTQVGKYLNTHGFVLCRESAAGFEFVKDGAEDCLADAAYPDAEGCPQPGFDIRVTVKEPDAEKIYYLEVKTHTTSSIVKNVLYISNEQMALAAKKKEMYYILNVLFDYKNMQGKGIEVYQDPVGRIADGTLRNTEKKYVFRISESV